MKYVLDTHTHTLASGHAYNTIREMAKAASELKLELLGITDHAPKMPGSCHEFYFSNLKVVERSLYGVQLLLGTELNILDPQGHVDMRPGMLKQMDIVIASMHTPCYRKSCEEEHTAAYINTMKNPFVQIIGHPDDGRFPVDYRELVKAAKEYRVLLEVNDNSLRPQCAREGGEENIARMLRFCRQYNTPVVIGSDAHWDGRVGAHAYARKVIEREDFPEELILNRSVKELKDFLDAHKF